MRLLVTRPQPEADQTAAALAALGHAPLLAPMLRTQLLPPPATMARPGAVLFTSVNAVRAATAWPETLLPRSIPALAVGDRTAAAAAAAGFKDVLSAAGDSTALADLALARLDPEAGPLLHPTIAEPAGALAARLQAAGFAVKMVEAYRMIAASALPSEAVAALEADRLDGVLFYSRRTAETFLRLAEPLRPHLAALLLYCLSGEVAAALDTGHIRIAARPNEASLLAMLEPGTEVAGIR